VISVNNKRIQEFNMLQNDMSNSKIKFIFPDPSKRIIHPWCESIIKEYKNKNLIQNDMSTAIIKLIYPNTSNRIIHKMRINDKRSIHKYFMKTS